MELPSFTHFLLLILPLDCSLPLKSWSMPAKTPLVAGVESIATLTGACSVFRSLELNRYPRHTRLAAEQRGLVVGDSGKSSLSHGRASIMKSEQPNAVMPLAGDMCVESKSSFMISNGCYSAYISKQS